MSTESRRKILDAAREEFAAYGLAGARVDRIAASSQCNKQLIYHYFGDKQGLYDAVLTELVLIARDNQAAARKKGLSYARDYLGSFDMGTAAQANWARLLAWEGLTQSPENAELESIRRENFRNLVRWLEEDQQAGVVTDRFTAEELYAFFLSATVFPYILPNVFRLVFGASEVTPEALASWRDTLRTLMQSIGGKSD